MTVMSGDEPADSRPFCAKCKRPVTIKSIREDGWIEFEPHKCKPTLRLVDTGIADVLGILPTELPARPDDDK